MSKVIYCYEQRFIIRRVYVAKMRDIWYILSPATELQSIIYHPWLY
ncbi:hypothetical protein [Okeania hirsuta]|nr:hypothetical protein [Okeania hirsuta]